MHRLGGPVRKRGVWGNEAIKIGILCKQVSGTVDCQRKQEEWVQSHHQPGLGHSPAAREGLFRSGVCLLVNKNGAAGEQAVHLLQLRIAHRDQQIVLELLINLCAFWVLFWGSVQQDMPFAGDI